LFVFAAPRRPLGITGPEQAQQTQPNSRLLDHLVSSGEQRGRHREIVIQAAPPISTVRRALQGVPGACMEARSPNAQPRILDAERAALWQSPAPPPCFRGSKEPQSGSSVQ